MPNLSEFVMVESLAHHRSVNAAAKDLELSPSALSRQLSALEVKLGIRIFDRDTRNFSLTTSGKVFLQAAEKVLSTAVEVIGGSNSHLRARLGRLSIVALPSITGAILPKLLGGFTAIHPGIDLAVSDEPSTEVVEVIENGDVDLGITAGTVALRNRLSFISLFEDYYTAISGKIGMSLTKDEYTLKELVEFPLISTIEGSSTRELIEAECHRKNLFFAPRIEITHASTALTMVSEGLGITILPILMLPAYRTENLRFHRISDLTKFRKIGIAYHPGRTLSPVANYFIKYVKEEALPLYQSIRKEFSV